MKFTQTMSTHLTPEWRIQYIDYAELKSILLKAAQDTPSPTLRERLSRSFFPDFTESFFLRCDRELRKVNVFYAEKLAEATRKHAALVQDLREALDAEAQKSRTEIITLSKRKREELRFAFSEVYLSLVLLQNYQSLNHTGFRKILKKHDKLFHTNAGHKWFISKVESAFFYTNAELIHLIQDTENLFTQHLEGGDRSRAMKRLRVPPLEEVQDPWTTFRVGFFLGAFVVLCLLNVVLYRSLVQRKILDDVNHSAFLYLNRGPFYLVIFLFLIGINVFGWRNAGVNHILIFEIDPRDHVKATDIMEIATALGVLWALSVLGFLNVERSFIPPYAYPLILMVAMVAFLFNPLPIFYSSARFWLLKVILRVVCSPFCHVGFADFWMGDQMNSLVTCLIDCQYTVCFYLTNWDWNNARDPTECMRKDMIITPILRCLPAWFRFAQCLRRFRDTGDAWPFLVNAGKYSTTFMVVSFSTLAAYYQDSYKHTFENPFVWGLLISYIISSIYCYIWDVWRDFGLFVKWSGENRFLRDHIVYSPIFYYFTIIENLLLRFFWAVAFILVEKKCVSPYAIQSISGLLEVIRRHIWNYIRLENEHLYNVGRFRAVRDIAVVPLSQADGVILQRMMDEIDGVTNRHEKVEKEE